MLGKIMSAYTSGAYTLSTSIGGKHKYIQVWTRNQGTLKFDIETILGNSLPYDDRYWLCKMLINKMAKKRSYKPGSEIESKAREFIEKYRGYRAFLGEL